MLGRRLLPRRARRAASTARSTGARPTTSCWSRSRSSCCWANCWCAAASPTACTGRCRTGSTRCPAACCTPTSAPPRCSPRSRARRSPPPRPSAPSRIPAFKSRGYDQRLVLGTIAAGATLGILIPPSINMIIYGAMTNTSVGRLYAAGVIPGPAADRPVHGASSWWPAGGSRRSRAPKPRRRRCGERLRRLVDLAAAARRCSSS